MTVPHIRAHIRLNSQAEVIAFIEALCKFEDSFTIENATGKHRVNAKSVIGVMYTVLEFPEELYLINDTTDGFIPPFVDAYRVL
ncbi:MAG: HPr family phosphocarrier protein [Clostridia bacterium]|nr:HPr family phosphocarrier protein [Clostridia bacterium]